MSDPSAGTDGAKSSTKLNARKTEIACEACELNHTRIDVRRVFSSNVKFHRLDQSTVAMVRGRTGHWTDGPAAFNFPQPHLRHELVVSTHVRHSRPKQLGLSEVRLEK